MKKFDPFELKRLSKLDPRRLLLTAYARFQDQIASFYFERYALEEQLPSSFGLDLAHEDKEDTAVTPAQLSLLVNCLHQIPDQDGAVVEVGAYRGVTTKALSDQIEIPYYAIDPFAGWGGSEADYQEFLKRISGSSNVKHVRATSGRAAQELAAQKISFVFVDAVHDYVNASFDGHTWGEMLSSGGLLAFHDVDDKRYAGVRKAVYEIAGSPNFQVFAHIKGLTVLRKIE